jgi:phenylalanyl-tRNA synthetase alpha chain
MQVVLNAHEAAILLALGDGELTLEALAGRAAIDVAQARSAVERLKLKGALKQTAEQVRTEVGLSPFGQECAAAGLPERRLLDELAAHGPRPAGELQQRPDLPASEAGAALGALRRAGVIELGNGLARLVAQADLSLWARRQALLVRLAAGPVPLDALTAEEQGWLEDRRFRPLLKLAETKVRSYRLTAAGAALRPEALAAVDAIGPLTPAMLQNGSWQGRSFRPYHIGLPPRLVAGSRNDYRRYLDRMKQRMLALGFQEMRGSLVENEFWNMDALFMPQFHPARAIHDVYFVAEPVTGAPIPEPHLSQIAAAHEGRGDYGSRGWGYLFDRERARRLILRSQGTALSARQLAARPQIPGKYFSMARCFRYDTVDATHAPDFIQIEGIVLGEEISLRHLLGLLMVFAKELAQAKEVRAVPDYFPFTEPSVEMRMRHPVLGWVELGGAGLFRPEVTRPLGIDVPVIAWGLGLDRMALVALGKNDIRHLFSSSLPRGLADMRRS